MTSAKFNARTARAPLLGGLSIRFRVPLTIALAAAFAAASALADEPEPIISKIEITGNQRIYADPIRIHISQQIDEPYDKDAVDADIKEIYKMGFFESVTSALEHKSGADVLVYKVRERPQIKDVKIIGAEAIRSDEIAAAVKIHAGYFLDPDEVKETLNNITRAYAAKGYGDPEVTFKAIPQPNNTVSAVFSVSE